MDNNIIPIIIILIVGVIYGVSTFFSMHERVTFYEEMEDNNVYQVYLDNGTFPLTINKIYNNELTMYADITFDYVKFYRVPSPLIFNFVRKTDEYDYGTIWHELQKYQEVTND
jgi:hypothetical protein